MTKESTKKAIDSYLTKHAKAVSRVSRTNNKPEQEVVKSILAKAAELGMFLTTVESKAVYSQVAGAYVSGQAQAGFPDLIGASPQGFLVSVEVKAFGRRSSLRPAQRDFLLKMISLNAFAICSDSASHFSSVYEAWLNAPLGDRKAILLRDLPKEKINIETPLFE